MSNDKESLGAFLCDLTVVKLGKKLRILGYDVEIVRTVNPKDIEKYLADGPRKLITKSRNLAEKYGGIIITKDKLYDQIEELTNILHLTKKSSARCPECNHILVVCSPESVIGKIPIYVLENTEEFKCCPNCGKVYWKGTHQGFSGIWKYVTFDEKKVRNEVNKE